ncbi:MAG: crotonase/enoyl-CoA hydratase family protein [Nevskiales bacterium]|nr:crotonase/enoyl-CoA hydratase family protein [Nevskiales bacterium]
MSKEKVVIEPRGPVLCMGLNRPEKRNAFDLDMYRQLAAAYTRLDQDPGLHCGLLHAQGDHFTAGVDLTEWMPDFSAGKLPDLPPGECQPFGLVPETRLSKPLIVVTQGICYTIGIELMLAADIRVAADNARFAQVEVKRGIYPVGGATLRLVQECGWGNAQRYLLTGDEFNAQEALRIGLVQEVVPASGLFERGLALAERVARQAPLGVRASLRSSRLMVDDGFREAVARLQSGLLPLMGSEDLREGLASFVERREARYKGR